MAKSVQDIQVVGVVGAGQMGNGIAQVAATYGFKVLMTDISESGLQKGKNTISSSLDSLIKKAVLTEEQKTQILNRIQTDTHTEAHKNSDIVIEAATENLDLKLKIFSELDKIVKPEAILASNTSSISITKIASSTLR